YMKKLRSVVPLQTFSRTGNIYCYIFSGLVRCDKCGSSMNGIRTKKIYTYYRCKKHLSRRLSDNSHGIRESTIENYLLNNLRGVVKEQIFEYETNGKGKSKPNPDKQKINTNMRKLKDLYLNDLIELNE